MSRITNPWPIFLNGAGELLDGGSIYIGRAGTDPLVPANRINVYSDSALTVRVDQPLRTLAGAIVTGANKPFIYVNETNWSIVIQDAAGETVYSSMSVGDASALYQPLDTDLTAIAALVTTPFGRSLLTLANAAALKNAAGVVDCLPLTGGSVTGNITRNGAGAFTYYNNAALIGGRQYGPDPIGTADATSQPGDVQWFY